MELMDKSSDSTEIKYIEKNIVRQVIKGDQRAFAELYNMYADKLYYFALKFLKSKEDTENLSQEVFVKIWETRERLDPDNSFNAYLFTIAKNTIFNIHRKKVNELAYRKYLGYYIDNSHSKTENDVLLNDLQNLVDRCVENFPAQRKKVFELSRKDGLSHKEISQQLDISEKTIETHIRLGLKTLREVLNDNSLIITAFIILLFSC
jgi:RNA polymerase sigma-70 factor (ECF subfamily)